MAEKEKRHFPALTLGLAGAVAIPLIQWLVTKEITMQGALFALIPLLTGVGTHTQVTPTKDIAPKFAEVAVETAKRLDATAAGPPGELTPVAEKIVSEVVAKVGGTGSSLAEQIVAKAKARAGL